MSQKKLSKKLSNSKTKTASKKGSKKGGTTGKKASVVVKKAVKKTVRSARKSNPAKSVVVQNEVANVPVEWPGTENQWFDQTSAEMEIPGLYSDDAHPVPGFKRYAMVLQILAPIGLGILIIGYLIHILGFSRPFIPMNEMPLYWGQNSHEFVESTGRISGWSRFGESGYAEKIGFSGLAILASVTLAAFLAILPDFIRNKNHFYTALALLQILVLIFSASGWITTGP